MSMQNNQREVMFTHDTWTTSAGNGHVEKAFCGGTSLEYGLQLFSPHLDTSESLTFETLPLKTVHNFTLYKTRKTLNVQCIVIHFHA